jgi:hypothetical protein
VFPILLQKQQTAIPLRSHHPLGSSLSRTIPTQVMTSAVDRGLQSYPGRFSQQTLLLSSPLEKLGLYRRKKIQYYYSEFEGTIRDMANVRKEDFYEDTELFVMWEMIRYGLTWAYRSYSRVLPSISVHPVVSENSKVWYAIQAGSVKTHRGMFTSGVLHPYSRLPDRGTLLHVILP